jgi:saccharopine dehydrogenase (NAD+, L-lysine-forming)
MTHTFGIRREDKNRWERRVPLTPDHLKELQTHDHITPIVQTSPIRAFTDQDFTSAGITVQEDLAQCPVIFAVKEIPLDFIEPDKTYIFFSHTIKGQKNNMPMLKKMMELGCTLIDYEKIVDAKGRRLVFFGYYAGLAGMVDSLWAFGQRMAWKGIGTPFSKLQQMMHYKNLADAKEHLKQIGDQIKKHGLHEVISPLVIGFAGYGNVSKGAQSILDVLPIEEIHPKQLEAIHENPSNTVIYKVVFKEEDIVEPIASEHQFDLLDYYNNPHLYRSIFHNYIRRITILMNCIFWSDKYPRLITKEFLEETYTGQMKLQVVGDISVDVNGAIEFTEKTTSSDNPVFVYNPIRDDIIDGVKGNGIVVMAVDNLPCELPFESSKAFSKSLEPFVPGIVKADYSAPFDQLTLPPEIKNAVILHQGKLTPSYRYLSKYL